MPSNIVQLKGWVKQEPVRVRTITDAELHARIRAFELPHNTKITENGRTEVYDREGQLLVRY